MKFLRDRQEIAKEININRTPVLTVNIDEPMKDYPGCYKGSQLLFEHHNQTLGTTYIHCTVEMFSDEGHNGQNIEKPWLYDRITIGRGCTVLHKDFSYHDVVEMVEWSDKRVVHAGQKVILFFNDRKNENACMRLMKISDKYDIHCSTVAVLEDVE